MLSNLSSADRDYIGHDLPPDLAHDLFQEPTVVRKSRMESLKSWCTAAAALAYLAASSGMLVRIANIGANLFS